MFGQESFIGKSSDYGESAVSEGFHWIIIQIQSSWSLYLHHHERKNVAQLYNFFKKFYWLL